MAREGRKVSALRKGTALSLSLAMALSCVPAQAFAVGVDHEEEGVYLPVLSDSEEESELAEDIVASGKWGTCPWEIDADGVLTVRPGEGKDTKGFHPWATYSDSITKAVFVADKDGNKVILPSDSSCLFNKMANLASIDFSGVDTSNVTDMSGMFWECLNLSSLDVSGFNTSKVTNMSMMFSGCPSLTSLDLSHFDTSEVKNVWGMFYICPSLTSLDLSGFDTSSVVDMGWMFNGCEALKTIFVSEKWSTASLDDPKEVMFSSCGSLVGGNGTGYDSKYTDSEYARVDTEEQKGYLTLKADESVAAPAFKNASLTVGKQIGLTFWFDLPKADDLDYSESKVHFSIADKDAREKDVPLSEATRDANGLYGFTFDVTSIEMAEPVTTTFHYKDANGEKTIDVSCSVQDYFEAFDGQAGSCPEKTVNLVHATADLGYYMYPYLAGANKWAPGVDYKQIDKRYGTYGAADLKKAADGLKTHGIKAELGDSGVEASASASFDSLTAVNVFLAAPDGAKLSAEATYGGKTYDAEKLPDGRWLVRVEGIRPQFLDQPVTVTGSCGGERFSVEVSVLGLLNLGYAKADNEAKAAFASAYFNWQAADAFIG